MPIESNKCKYLQILKTLNNSNKGFFNQKEIANYMEVSPRKMNDFYNGQGKMDLDLLIDYAAFSGRRLVFGLE